MTDCPVCYDKLGDQSNPTINTKCCNQDICENRRVVIENSIYDRAAETGIKLRNMEALLGPIDRMPAFHT